MGGTAAKTGKEHIRRILNKMGQLPHKLLHLFKHDVSPIKDAEQTAGSLEIIPIATKTIRRLEQGWKQQLRLRQAGVASSPLSAEENLILHQVKEATQLENRNNVTRTHAYLNCYRKYPELHWALLAHMVSRNGGWSMTDLRGELLSRLLNEEQKAYIFSFLERANGLIFHDAYPQLLLYGESKKRRSSLFHLLPHLGVSALMETVWNDFWTHQEPAALTIPLIINEQNYIEKRIVQNILYQQTVLNTPLFKTQRWVQLNQIGFPFISDSENSTVPCLAGLIIENFADLSERIEFGKSLYAILFGIPYVLEGVLRFTEAAPHTGSRSDYWPHVFAPEQTAPPDMKYQERLDGCVLKKGAAPFYSPPLAQAWPDRALEPVEPGDWFTDVRQPLRHMRPIQVPYRFHLTSEACLALNKIELAVMAGQALKPS